MTNGEKQSLEEISKDLFSASENLRDALDTIDLNGIETEYTPLLQDFHRLLEEMAKDIQHKARS